VIADTVAKRKQRNDPRRGADPERHQREQRGRRCGRPDRRTGAEMPPRGSNFDRRT
jgi:hypothetical protein